METICPLSNSPCSGVLKFKLASNGSANVGSAVSLDWVMDGKGLSVDWISGLRDRLGSVSYSKVESAGDSGTPALLHLFRAAVFCAARGRKKCLRPTCSARNADLDCTSLTRRMLHRRW